MAADQWTHEGAADSPQLGDPHGADRASGKGDAMSPAICPPPKHVGRFFEVAVVVIGFRVLVSLPRPFLGPHGQSQADFGGRLVEESFHECSMLRGGREVKGMKIDLTDSVTMVLRLLTRKLNRESRRHLFATNQYSAPTCLSGAQNGANREGAAIVDSLRIKTAEKGNE